MEDAGKDIIRGLVKGVEAEAELPVKAVKAVGSKILGGFKSVLSIFSPSKATQDMGHLLIAGLEKGINDESADTSKFIVGLAKLIPVFRALTVELRKASDGRTGQWRRVGGAVRQGRPGRPVQGAGARRRWVARIRQGRERHD